MVNSLAMENAVLQSWSIWNNTPQSLSKERDKTNTLGYEHFASQAQHFLKMSRFLGREASWMTAFLRYIFLKVGGASTLYQSVPHVYRFVVHSVRIVCFADNSSWKSVFCGARGCAEGISYTAYLKNLKWEKTMTTDPLRQWILKFP